MGFLRWGAAGGVLGAAGRDMANGAHVLAETVLHRQLRFGHGLKLQYGQRFNLFNPRHALLVGKTGDRAHVFPCCNVYFCRDRLRNT